jgi:hypothetical protein
MAGSYGINRTADFNPTLHAEVLVSYSETRATQGEFILMNTDKYLSRQAISGSTTNYISGIYNLKLPLEKFNKVGIYNIFIRPKQIETTIQDIGVLSAYPDTRGIILKTSDLTNTSSENDSLTGYRIEYYDQSGVKVSNLFRIVTSNNKCEPVNQNLTSSNQKSIRYRFVENSDLTFLTLTPSSGLSIKPNSLPYIGTVGTKIILTNTFFNPTMIEVELTENDIESLYTSLNGNQLINLDKEIVTTFDKNNNIVNQSDHYIIKENGKNIYKVKENKTSIDFSENFDNITSNV